MAEPDGKSRVWSFYTDTQGYPWLKEQPPLKAVIIFPERQRDEEALIAEKAEEVKKRVDYSALIRTVDKDVDESPISYWEVYPGNENPHSRSEITEMNLDCQKSWFPQLIEGIEGRTGKKGITFRWRVSGGLENIYWGE